MGKSIVSLIASEILSIKEKILSEKKEDMKRRGLASPDLGDALALTFAYPVAPKGMAKMRGEMAEKRRNYNPLMRR